MEEKSAVRPLTSTEKQLEEAYAQRQRAQLRIDQLVRDARGRGLSWEHIGRALQMTKQAVWEKYRYVDKFLS